MATTADGGAKARGGFESGRALLAVVLVLLAAALMLVTPAAVRAQAARRAVSAALVEAKEEPACKVTANPGDVIDIGELAHASSIATILEVECEARFSEKMVRIASNELWSKCDKKLKWIVASPALHEPSAGENEGKEIEAELDDDGNATVALIGGPSCAAEGGALVTVDLGAGTRPTTSTEVIIESPRTTPEGLSLYPDYGGKIGPGAIESATDSSLVGLAVIEFPPGYAEEEVSVTDRQLFEKCDLPPKIRWFNEGAEKIAEGVEATTRLDDDGNAFVVFEAGESCKAGHTLFEASLEEPPFTTLTADFKVLPPQSTFEREPTEVEEETGPKEKEKTKEEKGPPPPEEENLEVVKEQRFAGETEYSTAPKVGTQGQTVEYRIAVKDTGNTTIELTNLRDPHCEGVKGPSQKILNPGESAFYTCEHPLTEVGKYKNKAEVETPRRTKESNEVEVEVLPKLEFTIEKEQRIQGQKAYTKEELTATLFQVAEYRLKVTDTGTVAIKLSYLEDSKCFNVAPHREIELQPHESAIYTCEKTLEHVGEYVNQGEITATDGEGESKTKKSNEVLIDPPQCAMAQAAQVRREASGVKGEPFTLRVSSRGIRRIMVYVDGRELGAMAASEARDGEFAMTIDTASLPYGSHRLTLKTLMAGALCGDVVHSPVSATFVRPRGGSSSGGGALTGGVAFPGA